MGAGIKSAFSNNQKANSGEKAKVLLPDGKLVEVDKSQLEQAIGGDLSNEEIRKGIPGKKFIMVIDLGRCRNARKCVIACQKMHDLPPDQEWISVRLMRDSPETAPYWFPKACFHCDAPPCVKVCPVGATFKRDDGLVLIDNQRCIGCKFCMVACPYSTRIFNWSTKDPNTNKTGKPYSPETSNPGQHGTVGKCDFCPDMIRKGMLPDCITACPNGAIYFGDLNEDAVTNGDETARFSELIRDRAGYRYMEELGTEPNVYYLPPSDRMFPVERGFKDLSKEEKEKYKLDE